MFYTDETIIHSIYIQTTGKYLFFDTKEAATLVRDVLANLYTSSIINLEEATLFSTTAKKKVPEGSTWRLIELSNNRHTVLCYGEDNEKGEDLKNLLTTAGRDVYLEVEV